MFTLGHKKGIGVSVCCILGFKALFLAITDGKSQLILDFAILGEKGRNGNFGMSIKELKEHFTKERKEEEPLEERIKEYSRKKTDLMIEMIRRAIKRGDPIQICPG